MFTWVNKQTVESSQGFVVQFTGRFTGTYREGKSIISFQKEAGISGGAQAIIVDSHAFDHWDHGEKIEQAQQLQIFDNLRAACEFQDLRLVVG